MDYKEIAGVAKEVGGAFDSISKYRGYAKYRFEAKWNPEFVKTSIWQDLKTNDILSLVDNGPWHFGGKINTLDEETVTGEVWTD